MLVKSTAAFKKCAAIVFLCTWPVTYCLVPVRLGGDSLPEGATEGRLEVWHNGVWGTVCNTSFTDKEASVACYSLGYGYVGSTIVNRFGLSSLRVWLDNVRCKGDETFIGNCQNSDWGVHNCIGQTNGEVAIACNGKARLVSNKEQQREGRLEILYNNTWGTVCIRGFDERDASVACRSLRLGEVGKAKGNTHGSGKGPVWLQNVNCNGDEQSIGDCLHGEWGVTNCTHVEDVSISCNNELILEIWAIVLIVLAGCILIVALLLLLVHLHRRRSGQSLFTCRSCCGTKKNADKVVPRHWRKYARFSRQLAYQGNCVRTDLRQGDSVYRAIESLVTGSWPQGNIAVINVWLIENPKLYFDYVDHRTAMLLTSRRHIMEPVGNIDERKEVITKSIGYGSLSEELNSSINEYYLFHGTSYKAVSAVEKHGIDPRLGGRKSLFGQGCYMAETVEKSHNYTEANDSGSRFIFVLRVLLGEVYVSTKSSPYVRPPCTEPTCTRPNCSHRLCDSVMAVSKDGTSRLPHREFIVYDRQRCYPEFLVEYGISQGPRPQQQPEMALSNQVPEGSRSLEQHVGLQHHDEMRKKVTDSNSSREQHVQHHDEMRKKVNDSSSLEQHAGLQHHDEMRKKVTDRPSSSSEQHVQHHDEMRKKVTDRPSSSSEQHVQHHDEMRKKVTDRPSSSREQHVQHHDEMRKKVTDRPSSSSEQHVQHHDEMRKKVTDGSSPQHHVQHHDEMRKKVPEGSPQNQSLRF